MIRSRRVQFALTGLLLASLLLTSCGSYESPTAPTAASAASPQAKLSLPLLNTVTGLLMCAPQPAAHGQAVIGSAGGTLQVGSHTLIVPPERCRGRHSLPATRRPIGSARSSFSLRASSSDAPRR